MLPKNEIKNNWHGIWTPSVGEVIYHLLTDNMYMVGQVDNGRVSLLNYRDLITNSFCYADTITSSTGNCIPMFDCLMSPPRENAQMNGNYDESYYSDDDFIE